MMLKVYFSTSVKLEINKENLDKIYECCRLGRPMLVDPGFFGFLLGTLIYISYYKLVKDLTVVFFITKADEPIIKSDEIKANNWSLDLIADTYLAYTTELKNYQSNLPDATRGANDINFIEKLRSIKDNSSILDDQEEDETNSTDPIYFNPNRINDKANKANKDSIDLKTYLGKKPTLTKSSRFNPTKNEDRSEDDDGRY